MQIDQNNSGIMLFISKQVSLPKISSILQKVKIGQNPIYTLFAQRSSIKNKLLIVQSCNLFRFNLVTENFSQTLAFPPDSYKKGNVTYHFKKHGRMVQVSTYEIHVNVLPILKSHYLIIISNY